MNNVSSKRFWKSSTAGKVTFVLVVLGLLLSLYSSYEYVHLIFFPYSGDASCKISEGLNCEQALRSHYSSIFGRSLGNWGAIFYSGLLIFLLFYEKNEDEEELPSQTLSTIMVLALSSFSVSLFLFYVSMTQLEALCPVCLAMYSVSVLLLISTYSLESQEPFFARLGVGTGGLFALIRGIPRFLLGEVLPRLFSREFFTAIFALLVGSCAFFSDQGFYRYFTYTEDGDQLVKGIGEEWKAVVVQSIPSDYSAGPLQDYRKGPSDAAVKIVEFFDFECPYCRRFYFDLRDLQRDHPKSVSVEYRNYPLDKRCNPLMPHSFHENACEAALFSRCAGEEGKYFEALEFLMTLEEFETVKDPRAVRNAIRRGADTLSLDAEVIYECMKSDRQMNALKRDVAIGAQLGLEGTPAVWINGRLVDELDNIDEIVKFILGPTATGRE